jgi:F-type H+/Na+-transporting ATPase subunit beta
MTRTTQLTGTILSIQGQVVEVGFKDERPNLYDVLVCQNNPDHMFMVASSAGKRRFACLSFSSTESVTRGTILISTRQPLMMPVGEALLGRVIDIFGNALDSQRTPVEVTERWPVHFRVTKASEVIAHRDLLETGIKVVDMFTPLTKGGKLGLFGGAGVGKLCCSPNCCIMWWVKIMEKLFQCLPA